MNIATHAPLAEYTTMKLGGEAQVIVTVTTPSEIAQAVENAQKQQVPFFVLGGGSNVIAQDEGFAGMVILNRLPGFDIVKDDGVHVMLKIGAGENWDAVVQRTVERGLSGIEALSAIPGTAGATPVQNVGAYGQEIADTLVELEAYDSTSKTFVVLQKADCQFAYRSSIFKSLKNRRYIITSITLRLSRTSPQPPFYDSLQNYLDTHNITWFTPHIIRDAVIAIRREKLPSPSVLPNTGSFFKNPIIEAWLLTELRKTYDDLPAYAMADGTYKVPAGWLIERAELRGYSAHGMKVYDKNALVLVNETATSYSDLAAMRDEIVTKVHDLFRISLEQEPEELAIV